MIKRSYNLVRVMGIPIRIHITLIVLLLLSAVSHGLTGILLSVGVFTSIALHELGHSWVALRKGCHVREIMLLPIGGVAKLDQVPTRPMDELLMAAAGPAVSLLLAAIFWVLPGNGIVDIFWKGLAGINLMLGLFNLLPSFPMDGGRIFRALLSPRIGRVRATALAARIGRILAVAMGLFGLVNWYPILLLIAVFIYSAAGAEYRSVQSQQTQSTHQWFRPTPTQQADIHVSPPPYARQAPPNAKAWMQKFNDFFNELFKNWK